MSDAIRAQILVILNSGFAMLTLLDVTSLDQDETAGVVFFANAILGLISLIWRPKPQITAATEP